MCGEKFSFFRSTMIRLGSPPRVRGKVYFLQQGDFTIRITPAYAGKRRSAPAPTSKARDHPRVCGEKKDAGVDTERLQGSPPRMRGKENLTIAGLEDVGITPACAGKSASHGFFVLLRWDHPRVCGEKSYWSILARNSLGSPPRVRGKAVFPARQHRTAGITPACAGKRSGWPTVPAGPRDHPRVCGEKSLGISTPVAT